MTYKVKLGIIDQNNRITYGNYPISSDGTKILLYKEESTESPLNPTFTVTSALGVPNIFKQVQKVYFLISGSTKCIDFAHSDSIPKYNVAAVLEAAGNKILTNMGTEEIKTPWWVYLILLFAFIAALGALGVL